LTPVDVEPVQVRVRVPVFTDRRSKTIPVTPTVVGSPAAGFEVASITVSPPVVSVEGDANDLGGLDRADTEPISLSGASSQLTQSIGLALPDGVQPLGISTVQVTITLRPVTGTRTFEAGLVLSGARSDLVYSLSADHVLVTIGGSLADLDRLSGASLVLNVDVSGLGIGTHTVTVTANLATGTTLVAASPNPVVVTVSSPARGRRRLHRPRPDHRSTSTRGDRATVPRLFGTDGIRGVANVDLKPRSRSPSAGRPRIARRRRRLDRRRPGHAPLG
jgi:YbbR domain-containing protein